MSAATSARAVAAAGTGAIAARVAQDSQEATTSGPVEITRIASSRAFTVFCGDNNHIPTFMESREARGTAYIVSIKSTEPESCKFIQDGDQKTINLIGQSVKCEIIDSTMSCQKLQGI